MPRKKREQVKNLASGSIFGVWKTIMAPADDPEVKKHPHYYKVRNGEGLRLVTNPFPKVPGVYEVRFIPPGGKKSDAIVIYLGKAGGEDSDANLYKRMNQYMNNGSHKKIMYDSLLKGGCKVQVRVAKQGIWTRFSTGESKVKKVETFFLDRYDYAANVMENENKRFHEIVINVNGKVIKLDKFMVENGYPQQKIDKSKEKARKKDIVTKLYKAACKSSGKSPVKKGSTQHCPYTPESPFVKTSTYQLTPHGKSKLGLYNGFLVPLTSEGKPDMRYRMNKDLFG